VNEVNLLEAALLLVAGLTVTFTALGLLAGMIQVMNLLDERFNAFRIRRYSEKVETREVEEEINDELVAVITAAVESTLKRPVVIRRIRLFGGVEDPAWAVTGRLNIMASHAISKRRS
jgi:sodium pump decarboxylase gamma subunit